MLEAPGALEAPGGPLAVGDIVRELEFPTLPILSNGVDTRAAPGLITAGYKSEFLVAPLLPIDERVECLLREDKKTRTETHVSFSEGDGQEQGNAIETVWRNYPHLFPFLERDFGDELAGDLKGDFIVDFNCMYWFQLTQSRREDLGTERVAVLGREGRSRFRARMIQWLESNWPG